MDEAATIKKRLRKQKLAYKPQSYVEMYCEVRAAKEVFEY